MGTPVVLGVDRHRRGWVGALLDESGLSELRVARSFEELVAGASGLACVAVDMPIGLQSSGDRQADVDARLFVGPRRSSVFMTPPRAVLDAASFEEANRIAPTLLDGRKISRQTWSLKATILEVEQLAKQDDRIIEVHPEVSFRAMMGDDLAFSKHGWNGITLRRNALASQGLEIPDIVDIGGEVPPADLLDALAAGWSARRFVRGQACALPEAAKPGQHCAIWY
jgi:predicted RNase H-like nuclease